MTAPARWTSSATTGDPPHDPIGQWVAQAVADVLQVTVDLLYSPDDGPAPVVERDGSVAAASGTGPPGWRVTYVVRLPERVARLVASAHRTNVGDLLDALPGAGVAVTERFRGARGSGAAGPALRRAIRDTLAAEVLGGQVAALVGDTPPALVAEIIDYLIELSSTRVESRELTHGVVIGDIYPDTPRLRLRYPADIRAAKRAPLLFDGQRSVLIVDPHGRARTEMQRHRFAELAPDAMRGADAGYSRQSGSFVASVSAYAHGVGFFLRADRSIWTFVDGDPLLVRQGEHWTGFPLELTTSIENMIGGGQIAAIVTSAAFIISAQPHGAILAIVDDPVRLDGVVSPKDRYDLRDEFDPAAMRPETRLHHLIDAGELDEQTVARLATLDGATILDREGRLLAYGAIVTSSDSQYEGARTAAARTLSEHALVVLKVSVDGDITVFRDGAVVTTLLGRRV